jgi:hypothetical protein
MLRKRRDPLERLTVAGAHPVLRELGAVELRPLANEPHRAVGQGAGQNLERVDRDRCIPACVEAWKCGTPCSA